MGIDLTALRALIFAKRVYGFEFRNTVMLGRQEIHFWEQEYMAVRKNVGVDFEYDDSIALGQFSEPLFQKLGAENITSVDASAYEGASLNHDFNLPIPEQLCGRFDAFVDFGSIEHVFNVAQVVNNIAKIVRTGGSILIVTIANGFPAHGFYQYSPEFFYTVFSKPNGFSDTSVFLVSSARPKMWHWIRSPAMLERRNEIPPDRQFWIIALSRKYESIDVLSAVQSDYRSDKWTKTNYSHFEPWNKARTLKYRTVPRKLLNTYVYKRIAYTYQYYKVLGKYRADRVLINPDVVDKNDFMLKLKTEFASKI